MLRPFRLLVGVAILAIGSTAVAQDKSVCITIDDLPCASCLEGTWQQVTTDLLTTLDKHHVPAIGFVNEGKLYHGGAPDSSRYALLVQWLQHGQELGNHTFGHEGVNGHTVAEYEMDVLKGEQLLRPLMHAFGRELRYFRHPFLQTGPTPGHRDSLNAMLARYAYTVAPVTFDNDEYIHAWCYAQALGTGNDTLARQLAAGYITYMQDIVRFHEEQTQEFLGRAVPQVLLIHANALNAAQLDTLLTWFEQRGYAFIPLSEALKDPAYSLPEATTPYGFSWIRRWRLAAGQKPPWPPEVAPWVAKLYEQHR